MELKRRIYENIRSQLVVGIQTDRIQSQLNDLLRQRERLSGAIEILSSIYKDETGRDLQRDINADPSWAELVKSAEKEAEQIVAGLEVESVVESVPQDVDDGGKRLPRLRSVSQNKTVELPKDEKEQPEQDGERPLPTEEVLASRRSQPSQTEDRKSPIKIVIDDNPPGPNTPDKPDKP